MKKVVYGAPFSLCYFTRTYFSARSGMMAVVIQLYFRCRGIVNAVSLTSGIAIIPDMVYGPGISHTGCRRDLRYIHNCLQQFCAISCS